MTCSDQQQEDDNTCLVWVSLGKVELKVTHCGLCSSDIEILEEGWSPTSYPCCVGHEIAGVVTRVGNNVSHLQVGDRAGAGAQCFSCLKCPPCLSGLQNLCHAGVTMTFNSHWPNGDTTFGGFADKWREDYRFIHKIPEGLSNEDAASFFFAGGTVYTPMARWGVQPGSTVGVLGMGGLGHYTALFGKAIAAKVVSMSRGEKKRDVSMKLGCDGYVNIDDPKDMERIFKALTHIVCTGYSQDFKWEPYVAAMKENGVFILVAAPRYDLPTVNPLLFTFNQVSFTGSMASSPAELKKMLAFAAEHHLKPWITKYPMKDINKAVDDFKLGIPRFRFILEN